MWRYFVGGIAALLMAGAGVFLFQSNATPEVVPQAPKPAATDVAVDVEPIADVPQAAPKTREEKRFNRYDKDRDERITLAELTQPRRKAFAKLDKNGDGKLSFEEWAVRTTDRFAKADADRNGVLTRAEFATTAPKRRAKTTPRCDCRAEVAKALAEAE
ncbi:MAG: histidine kinase [Alphaproteobacteria bacterium HGW-Alphaproteobacteria-16]|nr:MAG: histidine kinase [Alphaproteobacteria bacterium HGW-Alphaproteobacteria-16]